MPGEVHGAREAWKRHGRLPWKDLVQPAINLSKNGFNVTKAVAEALQVKEIKQYILRDPGLRSVHITCVPTAKAQYQDDT